MNAARKYLNHILSGAEVGLSIFLIFVIIVIALRMIFSVFTTVPPVNGNASLYIEQVMNLAIGIEFAKMLFHHTPGTVIEVLLFAISRHMIVEHPTALETLLGVISIACLFAVKKYLFSSFREHERIIIPGQTTIRKMSLRYGISIPADGSRMLCDVVREHLAVQGKPVESGVSFSIADATLRLEEVRDGSIKKVEVVKVRSIFDE